jgi:hypothetical protein
MERLALGTAAGRARSGENRYNGSCRHQFGFHTHLPNCDFDTHRHIRAWWSNCGVLLLPVDALI